MKILKFGGTSVGSPESIKKVISILAKEDADLGVVFSAFSGVTDSLIDMSNLALVADNQYQDQLNKLESRHLEAVKDLVSIHSQSSVLAKVKMTINELEDILKGVSLVGELSPQTLDLVMSFGERLSGYIISEALKDYGKSAVFLDARELVKANYDGDDVILDKEQTYQNIHDYFRENKGLYVITGFIASTSCGKTITLGRGGSDYTASLFGAALGAECIEIWTDVNGVMTADPRKVPNAFSIEKMSYQEAMEMSYFGAKVIHPPTMQPALEKDISIIIKNTFEPCFLGTSISKEGNGNGYAIKGISSIEDVSLLRIEGSGMVGVTGTAARLFGVLARNRINIILITQASSEHSICLAIKPEFAELAQKLIEDEFEKEINIKKIEKISIEENLSVIAVVGENMKKAIGLSGKLFTALGENKINVVAIAQGSSELNISVVIYKKDEEKALNAIHNTFFTGKSMDTKKQPSIFLLGTGVIGGELLKQIKSQKEKGLDISVKGIANINGMIIGDEDIFLGTWQDELAQSGESADIEGFVLRMKAMNKKNVMVSPSNVMVSSSNVMVSSSNVMVSSSNHDIALRQDQADKCVNENYVFVDCTANEKVSQMYEGILRAGISVVTPNKKANSSSIGYYHNLRSATEKSSAKFLYETNVGAGLPVISMLKDLQSAGDEIIKIEAILSGTLSYIFNTFSGDTKFSEVVRIAKEKGFTEPDPRDDLNGLDVARKLLILAREIGLSLEMSDMEVENLMSEECQNAENIDDFFKKLQNMDYGFSQKKENASIEGKVLRYIGYIENGKAKVSLQAISQSHPFYSMNGADNIVSLTTKYYCDTPLVVKGPGAGAAVTAAGVFADVLRCV